MNKLICLLLIGSLFGFSSYKYNGSTISSVVLAGGVIKAQNTNIDKKYKRKNCPVCKGTGYYISGDKITKVNCGYCEPDKNSGSPAYDKPKIIIHSPIVIEKNCQSGTCSPRK